MPHKKRINQIFLILFFLALIAKVGVAFSQTKPRFRLAFYDVGRCYDTLRSIHYRDEEYLPEGAKAWNTERYRKKIEAISRTIDTLKASLVILRGIENKDVLRDIQSTSRSEYSSLHRTLNYYDGLDFALLYHGDKFQIESAVSNGYYLFVAIESLEGERLYLHLTRDAKWLHSIDNEPQDAHQDRANIKQDSLNALTLAMGGFSPKDLLRLKLVDALSSSEKRGEGERRSSHAWYFYNRVGFKAENFDVSARPYINKELLTEDGFRPLATFDRHSYLGGASTSLPIIVNIYPL